MRWHTRHVQRKKTLLLANVMSYLDTKPTGVEDLRSVEGVSFHCCRTDCWEPFIGGTHEA